ncbi:MAG: efflux RND transporter permease subunit, partial [Candidatus Cryptobacteroides sp.]
MLDKIIKFSLNNRFPVLVAACLIMGIGIYTASRMEVDVFPDLNAPTVVVMTEAGGMAPEEVERLVTFPVETAVNGASDVRRVRSSSTTGFSIVWVEFDWGTDIYKARQIVSEKLALISDSLPEGVGSPTLGPQSSILGELMFISLSADSTSMQDLRTLADWTVRPRILSMGGVAQVAVIGGELKEYQIELEPALMRRYEVSLKEVFEAVEGMNSNSSGGILYEYGNEYIIRGMLSTDKLSELGNAFVKMGDGAPVLIKDIAKVKIGNHLPKMGTASHDGRPAVMITVTKQPNTNTVELSTKIDRALEELAENLPSDVQISTDIYRQERFIQSSINNVGRSLL